MENISILPTGDCALTIEYENRISIEVSRRICMLEQTLAKNPIEGIIELVPTYRAIMVHYKPEIIRYTALCDALKERLELVTDIPETVRHITELPVCYGGVYGPDLEEVARREGITPEEVIHKHTINDNYVFMIGFAPGMPYIGSSEPTFSVPRLPAPRLKIPRGSVGVWESQTVVIPLDSPSGWHIIGRTPIKVYDPDRQVPGFFHTGQWIRFKPVSEAEFIELDQQESADS